MRLTRGEINLYVTSLDDAVTFYEQGLGFELHETGSENGYRKLKNGEVILTLFLARKPGPADPPGSGPSMTTDLHVDDIDEAARRLEGAGAKVTAVRDWPGGRHLMFSDPDGISWELLSP